MAEKEEMPMPPKDWMVRNIALVLARQSGTPEELAEHIDAHLRGNWAMCCMARDVAEASA